MQQSKPEEEAANELASATLTTAVPRSTTGHSSPDDYYQTVAINALLSILRDQSMSGQHHKVIEAIMSIFKTQGLKCVSFLPQVRSSYAYILVHHLSTDNFFN